MGVVYRAVQDNPSREVALKVIRPGTTTPERLRRFEHEAKVLARLHHPGIAQVFEAGVHGTGTTAQPFFAMELIEGRTLLEYAREKHLAPRESLRLFIKVCDAVQHAHQRGYIHRDLKPDILIDASGQPKVIDFGVARVTDAELQVTTQGTSVGQLVGTLRYMSPEQVLADPDALDTRSDVYTLGVICYELLTGRLPYDLKSMTIPKMAKAISEAEPTPLSSVNKIFRGDLDTIVSKALEKDKTRRYQSASELAADLERYLTDRPILARPAGAVYQFRKFARRNKALVSGVGATLVALVAGIIGTTWWAVKAQRAETRADKSATEVTEKAVRLAIQRGAWRDALEYIDKAIEPDAGSKSVALRLDRIRALFAINEPKAAGKEVKALADRKDLGELEGSVLLLRADVLQGKDVNVSRAMVEEALTKKLSDAEREYARALIAETTPQAVEHLQKSLELDPYQQRAHSMRSLLLLTLGRREEARVQISLHEALFPEDPNVNLLHAVLAASENNAAEAEKQLQALEGRFDEAGVADVKVILEMLTELCDPGKWANPQSSPDMPGAVQRLAPIFKRRWQLKIGLEEDLIAARALLPTPPVMHQSFGEFAAALALTQAGKPDEQVIAALDKLYQIHPDGFVRYFAAMIHFGAGRWAEADKDGLAAADMVSMFPIHRQALIMAATAEGLLGSPKRKDSDPERRKKAARTLRRAIAYAPIYPYERDIGTKIALNADDLSLARDILDKWDAQTPDDPLAIWLRARLEFKSQAYGLAIALAKKYLEKKPDDAEMKQIIKEATEKLRKEAGTLPP
jgi:tetratricopeptide (TPR) repeat protein